ISGKSGCGNSTVSRIVAKRLGYKLVNYTFHSIAQEIGVSFDEMCELAEQDDKWDHYVDERQVEMARDGNTVLGSRLAIWVLDDADFRVYLDARLEVRAGRIQKREGGALEQVSTRTTTRDRRDHDRYLRLYGIDNNNFSFVDLVVDTEDMTPEEIADVILESVHAPPAPEG
ncbi:MAG: cytidylate kinase family protein, partial [Spirochaetia bacterium]